jgi:predicted metal-dependent peptidase
VAADYVVNDELIETHIGKFPTEMIKGVETPVGLYDPKYHGWNSERVYDELLKEQQQQEQSNPGSGESSLSEMLDKLLDEHLDPKSGEGDGNSESGGGDTPGKSGPAKLTDEERAQLKAEMTEHILNAAKTCSAGNLPGGIKRMIQDLTDPKMNWRELIQTTIDSLIPCDYSYLKMNRKGWGLDAVLPGMTTDKMLKVAVFIDMSGSIGTEQARSFLSEVNGMMQQFQNYEILVGCFDTEVQNVQTFSADNGEDIRTYQPMGGGGTSFECIFDYLKEESIIPETLCIFTDGYPNNTFGDEFYCPTIFLIEGSKVVPPFGQYAYIEEGDLK